MHWPFMYTERLGHPLGDSAALMDINTIARGHLQALVSAFTGTISVHGLGGCVGMHSAIFFRSETLPLTHTSSEYTRTWMAGIFFLLSPPLTLRVAGHFALTNHWIILAALLIFCRAQYVHEKETRAFNVAGAALTVISTLVNPYLAFQACCLLCAGTVSLLWQLKNDCGRCSRQPHTVWSDMHRHSSFLRDHDLGGVAMRQLVIGIFQ